MKTAAGKIRLRLREPLPHNNTKRRSQVLNSVWMLLRVVGRACETSRWQANLFS